MKKLLGTLLLLFAGSATAATIGGTATSSEDGATLGGMVVAAYASSGSLQATATTATNGTWTMTVPAGTYRVLAYDPAGLLATSFYDGADSFETARELTLTANQSLTGIAFRLARGGRIVGRVTSASGALLASITIEVYNPSGTRRGFTTTDLAGNYAITVPPGSYRLIAFDSALHYASVFFPGGRTFEEGHDIAVAAAADTRADVQMTLGATISGKITERGSGAPLAGMRVTAYGADGIVVGKATSAGDGRYGLVVPPGVTRIVIHDPAGVYAASYSSDASSFATATPYLANGGDLLTVNASLDRAGRIEGTVRDRITGEPISGVTVAAYNRDGTIRAASVTTADGRYSIVVPPGDYVAGAYDEALRYLPQFFSNATFTSALRIGVLSQQAIGGNDFSLARGAVVEGVVRDRFTTQLLSSITVRAYNVFGQLLAETTSDANGAWRLLLVPGSYRLLAFDPALRYATGFFGEAPSFSSTPTLAAIEGTTITAALSLPPAGRIIGTVYAAATNIPLAALDVLAYDAAGNLVASVTTDVNGVYRLALPSGSYRIAAADPAHRYVTAFHANATSFATATSVTLAASQEISGIRFTLARSVIPARRRAVR